MMVSIKVSLASLAAAIAAMDHEAELYPNVAATYSNSAQEFRSALAASNDWKQASAEELPW